MFQFYCAHYCSFLFPFYPFSPIWFRSFFFCSVFSTIIIIFLFFVRCITFASFHETELARSTKMLALKVLLGNFCFSSMDPDSVSISVCSNFCSPLRIFYLSMNKWMCKFDDVVVVVAHFFSLIFLSSVCWIELEIMYTLTFTQKKNTYSIPPIYNKAIIPQWNKMNQQTENNKKIGKSSTILSIFSPNSPVFFFPFSISSRFISFRSVSSSLWWYSWFANDDHDL